MGIVRVQHIYKGISTLPKDQFVNSFYFVGPGQVSSATWDPVTPAHATALVAAVSSFYNGVSTGQTLALTSYIAITTLHQTQREQFKVYDMTQAQPRRPIHDSTPTHTAGGNMGPIPSEVAVCLSYNAAPMSGMSAGRRRGRIFLGPLNLNANAEANGRAVPTTALLTAMRLSALRMAQLAKDASFTWCMYSPTTAAAVVPGGAVQFTGAFPIAEVSTDDAWDTQRRRGIQPSFRTRLAVPQ